jgi:hypothetical protein
MLDRWRRLHALEDGGDVGGWRAFAEHLRDGVAGDEVDEQEDEAHDQPDDREGVEDALEYGFQIGRASCRERV